MGRSKTVRKSDWRSGFLFVGNHLALDFLNTRPVQDGGPVELLPDFGALLRWVQAAEMLAPFEAARLARDWKESMRAERTVEAMRVLRERLRKEVLAWESGGAVRQTTVEILNRLMSEHPMLIRLTNTGESASTELWFKARQPEDLFAPLAHSAAMLFSIVDRDRVRKCGQCVLHFYDTSKKGTRHWCSMQLCGNRLKVATYAARQRLRAPNPPNQGG
jgi:predicted RNA-binding Zn ribbon-like protein